MNITKAAVLGAGTMGAGIAAHLSNAGIPTLLLDIAPGELTESEAFGAEAVVLIVNHSQLGFQRRVYLSPLPDGRVQGLHGLTVSKRFAEAACLVGA